MLENGSKPFGLCLVILDRILPKDSIKMLIVKITTLHYSKSSWFCQVEIGVIKDEFFLFLAHCILSEVSLASTFIIFSIVYSNWGNGEGLLVEAPIIIIKLFSQYVHAATSSPVHIEENLSDRYTDFHINRLLTWRLSKSKKAGLSFGKSIFSITQ